MPFAANVTPAQAFPGPTLPDTYAFMSRFVQGPPYVPKHEILVDKAANSFRCPRYRHQHHAADHPEHRRPGDPPRLKSGAGFWGTTAACRRSVGLERTDALPVSGRHFQLSKGAESAARDRAQNLTLLRKAIDPMRSFAAGMPKAIGTIKRFATVVRGFALLFGTFLPSLVVVQFQLNRAEIIRTKCVQRDRPIERNCCKGKCHLKKELKKAEGSTKGDRQAPRFEPLELIAAMPVEHRVQVRVVSAFAYPRVAMHDISGHRAPPDHVPWTV